MCQECVEEYKSWNIRKLLQHWMLASHLLEEDDFEEEEMKIGTQQLRDHIISEVNRRGISLPDRPKHTCGHNVERRRRGDRRGRKPTKQGCEKCVHYSH